MNKNYLLITILAFPFNLLPTASARNYIVLDFETEATGLSPTSNMGYPLWSLHPTFDNVFGSDNHFEISTNSHSGEHSLKFTYEARNNFCNTCGGKTLKHKKGLDDRDYFVANNGEDLTQEYYPAKLKNSKKPKKGIVTRPAPHAEIGKIIYNKSRGYSQWEITGISKHTTNNDQLSLKLLQPGIGEYKNRKSVFNGGDKTSITRQCGMDGIIGKVNGEFDINRRSDCNNVIVWFGDIKANIQPTGSSIFRRVYLQSTIKNAPTGHKLNYARLLRGGDSKISRGISTIASFHNDKFELHLTGFKKMGGLGRYRPGTNNPKNIHGDLNFENATWYYLEQEYKAETFTIKTHVNAKGKVIIDSYRGNGDGEYRLWFAKSGEESETPVLELKKLHLPPFLGGTGTHMSLWGNIGHHTNSYGNWYMDDIKISTEKIGPVVKADTDTPELQ